MGLVVAFSTEPKKLLSFEPQPDETADVEAVAHSLWVECQSKASAAAFRERRKDPTANFNILVRDFGRSAIGDVVEHLMQEAEIEGNGRKEEIATILAARAALNPRLYRH